MFIEFTYCGNQELRGRLVSFDNFEAVVVIDGYECSNTFESRLMLVKSIKTE